VNIGPLEQGKISEEEFDFELGFEQEAGQGGRAGAAIEDINKVFPHLNPKP